MNTSAISYKNLTINIFKTANDVTRYSVDGAGFNPDGYPTLGHAKGAITKAENATAALSSTSASTRIVAKAKQATASDADKASAPVPKIDARISDLEAIEQPLDVVEAGNGGDFGIKEYHELAYLRDGVPVPQIDAATDASINGMVEVIEHNDIEGWIFGARTPNGDPIHANPVMASVYAEMDYFGMSQTYDPRSRAKREGNPAFRFYVAGLYSAPKNRKQRKAEKMLRRYLKGTK